MKSDQGIMKAKALGRLMIGACCLLLICANLYAQIPTVTSFAPASGPVGTSVTVTGTNFSTNLANNIVFFGAAKATVSAASTTSLTVAVPKGATFQPISVLVGALTAYSSKPFIVTFPSSGTGFDASSFSLNEDFVAGSNPFHTAIADLNFDGKSDLIVMNNSDWTLSIYKNISSSGTLGPSSFDPPTTVNVGKAPQSVTAGDVNGDGKIDLVTSNALDNNISVLINTFDLGGPFTNIIFASAINFNVGSIPKFVALHDLDNDGLPEAIVSNYSSNTISVLKNTTVAGTINFAAKVDFTTGGGPTHVTVADLNLDGKPDIAVSNEFPGFSVSVFRNVTTAGVINLSSFDAKVDYTVGNNPNVVSVGDFDGDGKPDMAVANNTGFTVSVLRNTSSVSAFSAGSFAPRVDLVPFGGDRPSSLAIADLDGDGKLDIASTNQILGSVSIFKNNCSPGSISVGSFGAAIEIVACASPIGLSVGDLDGDGKPDMFMASSTNNSISVLRNLISGPSVTSFSPQSGVVGASVTIDGAGFSSTPSNNIVYFGATKAVVTAAAATSLTAIVPLGASYEPISVTVNGLIARTTRPFSVTFPGQLIVSASSFAPKVDFATGSGPLLAVVCDLDGDGKPDLAVNNPASNSVSVLRSTSSIGAPTFEAKDDFITDTNPVGLAVGDLDGDGKADLVTANNASGVSSVSILKNTSTSGSITAGSFAPKVEFQTETTPRNVALGDLDGDGKTDIVVTCVLANKISVLRNTINGPIGINSFATKSDFTTGASPIGIAIGDVDNDGKPDVVVTNSGSNTISVFKNKSTYGNISLAAKIDFSAGLQPNSVAIGDLDGDGKPDLTVVNSNNHTISLYRNTASDGIINSSSFSPRVIFSTGASSYPEAVSLTNLDGDAKADILVLNRSLWTISVFRNTASTGVAFTSGTLAPKQDFNTGVVPLGFAVNDLDLDGMPDLVPLSNNDNLISVLLNTNGLPTPVASAASAIAQNSLTANWASVATATEYRLDVSSDNFVSYVSGYNDLAVTTGTSKSVTGLAFGTNYKYRVRAFNASGVSTNSSSISALTLPATPVSGSVTSLAQTGFTANWAAAAGAVDYRLDVSLSTNNFSPNVTGYDNLTVTGTSRVVTGLVAGTNYIYRVRAANATGPTDNSSTQTALTIPANPVAVSATSISSGGFTVNWSASIGATSYLLDVSLDNFVGYVSGFNAAVVTGTSFSVTGLTPGTAYQYRLRAVNTSGTSVNSNTISSNTLCSAPTANAASSIAAISFTANWTAVTGAVDYRIDVSSDPSFAFIVGSYNNQTVTGTSLAVSGLTPGTNYYYRVRASNVSGSSSNSGPISVLTLPAAPVANDALSITTTTFGANWNPVSTATGYIIDVSTVNTFASRIVGYDGLSVALTSITVTVPTAGITYYYRVRAVNATGTSANSNTITTLLKPAAPVATAASTFTTGGFTANWASASGAVTYSLEVSADNFSSISSFDNLNVTTLAISGLNAGTTYKYRVTAVNAFGPSATSNVITTVTVAPAPVATSATTFSTSGFTATWSSTQGATSYLLDVSTVSGFGSFVSGYNGAPVSGTSTAVTGLTNGTTYYYRLRAVNSSGNSINSNTISVINLSLAPTASAASSITSTGFTATWTAPTGASDYRIDVSTSNGFGSFVGSYNNQTVGVSSLDVIGLLPGTTYYYRVRANNASGPSINSNTITVTTAVPETVAISATAISTTGFTARWTAMSGASGYLLDVSLNNFAGFVSGYNGASVTGTSAVLTGLTSGTTYQYRLKAVYSSGPSIYSNISDVITLPVTPTASAASSITPSGFTASWSSVTGASDYRIDVSTSNTFSSFTGTYNNQIVGETSLTVTGLVAGTTYYYRVRGSNASGSSANSNVITTLTNPAAPIASAATAVTINGFTANWGAVSGATGYRLDVSSSEFVGNEVDNLTVSGTSSIVSGLTPGVTYKYRIRSVNATGPSDNSNVIATFTVPDNAVAIAATSISTTGFTANWNLVSGASAYFLDVSINNAFGSFLSGYNNRSVTGNFQLVTGLSAGTVYYYRLRAANASGTSGNSNIISTITVPGAPIANAATVISASGFTANWASATGATQYNLDISTDNTFSSVLSQPTSTGTSVVVNGLSSGTNYYYRVRASNGSGSSANSGPINVLTLPGAPSTNDATTITSTSFVASWNLVSSATSYVLDVATTNVFTAGTFAAGFDGLSLTSTSTTVTSLTAGTTYYYRVRAISAAGTSSNSNVVTTLLKPAAPVASTATIITADGFTANWSTVPGVLGYYLDVSSNNFSSFLPGFDNFPLSGISQVITGLNAGISYQYRVRSYNLTGSSVNSSTITTITIPPAPTAISASSFTATSFTANWQATIGASSYRLDVSSDPAFGSFFSGFENLSVTGTSSSVSGLTPGTVYYYQVRAVNASGTSPNSNTISSTNIPPPPSVASATTISTTSFNANWSITSGALSYLLDVSDNNFSSFVSGYNDLSVTGNSQSITGLTAGTAYQYRVRATNASGTSSNSATISVQTLPAEPITQATAMNFSAITISSLNISYIAASGGPAGYIVIRKIASSPTGLPIDGVTYSSGSSIGDGTVAYVGSATTFSESSLSAGTGYFYDVYAYNGSSISTNYNTNSPLEGSTVTLPDAPVALAATLIGQTLFNANWISASGATGYFIDVSTDDFSTYVTGYNSQPTGNITSIGVSSLAAASTYQYRIRSVNASGSSINSNSISVLTIPPTPTALSAAGASTTGFTANWSGSGTTNFFIDVSSDNFSTFVTGYNNLAVDGSFSQNITGLNIGTTYKYRIRSSNSSGVSPSSSAISATTLVSEPTAQPTTLTFSSVTINSVDLSFTAALGSPTGYLVLRKAGSAPLEVPADGIVYSVGGSIGSSTVVNIGSTSFSEVSLNNETNYFYSIYSYNGAGTSINYLATTPLQGSKSTLAVEPISQPTLFNFTPGMAGLYSLSFTPVAASGYLIIRKQGSASTEIPSDGVPYLVGGNLGSSTVANYTSASLFDETLLSNSTYFYTVFSFNGSGASVNYRTVSPLVSSLLTVPDAPIAKPSSNNTTTSFDANWDAVSGTGAVTYQVEISKDDFLTIAQSLPLLSATTVRINNLSPSTDYQYRVRAKNASGLSTNSIAIAARTSDVSLANVLKINTLATSTTLSVGFNQAPLTANVSGGTGIRSVIMKYRGILGGAYASMLTVDKGSDNFEAIITESKVDELGLEYYFEATDELGALVKSNGNSFIYLSKSSAAVEAIPFTSDFDGTSGTYEMFSVPYVLTDKNISGIFDELGAPDKTQWRLFHFKGNKYIEYPDNITTLELGKGYWFNAKEKIDIKPGAGELSKANQSTPFQITFEKGWNQIGNPYPFNIDWNVIKNANQVAGLNGLWLFEKGAYAKKDVLATWKGAFVFSDNGGTVNFPVSSKTSATGRVTANELLPTIDKDAWQLPLTLSLNGMDQISSIGMHPDANASKDGFDEITMPRFIDYLEMDTYHKEFFAHNFSSDIVPTTSTASWVFTVSSNQKGNEATITWDHQALFNSHAKIALLDLQTQTLVDMKTTGIYRFSWTEGRQFKILYSKDGELLPGITLLGNAYPNPFNAAVTIPFMLQQDEANLEVVIYDMLGRKVKVITTQNNKAGIHNLEWAGGNEQGEAVESGMYFYQLRSEKGTLSSTKRLLKQ